MRAAGSAERQAAGQAHRRNVACAEKTAELRTKITTVTCQALC